MKLFLSLVTGLVLSVSAFAQSGKKMSAPARTTVAPAVVTAYTGPTQNEITGNFGLHAGAVNFGVTYVKANPDFGFGGYFFMQSSKDKNNTTVVNQIMAFGGLLKVNIVNNNKIRAFMAPGFGMAMLKDASVNAAGKKSDENLISPTFKMGVQYKFNSNILVGIERMLVTNWLNDSINTLGYPTEYTSVAATYEF